eukprot:gene8757-6159_t
MLMVKRPRSSLNGSCNPEGSLTSLADDVRTQDIYLKLFPSGLLIVSSISHRLNKLFFFPIVAFTKLPRFCWFNRKSSNSPPSTTLRSVFKRDPHAAGVYGSERTASVVEITAKKNPFTGTKDLPDPPRPDEKHIPRDLPPAEQIRFIQDELDVLSYNHLPHTFFCLDKHRSLDNILSTGRDVLADALPIRCLEATFVGLYLTQHLKDVHRMPLSFGSWVGGKFYSHIVLVLYVSSPELRFGAIGLSRKSTLMYKPLVYPSLFALVMDYKRNYEALGHKLSDIRLGLTFTHQTPCFRQPCWRFVALKLSSYTTKKSKSRSSVAAAAGAGAGVGETEEETGAATPPTRAPPAAEPSPAAPPVSPREVTEQALTGTHIPLVVHELEVPSTVPVEAQDHEESNTNPSNNNNCPTDADSAQPAAPGPSGPGESAAARDGSPQPDSTHLHDPTPAEEAKYHALCTFLARYVRLLPVMADQYNKINTAELATNRSMKMCFADLDEVDGEVKAENKRRLSLIDTLLSPLSRDALLGAPGFRSSCTATEAKKSKQQQGISVVGKKATSCTVKSSGAAAPAKAGEKKKRTKSKTRTASKKKKKVVKKELYHRSSSPEPPATLSSPPLSQGGVVGLSSSDGVGMESTSSTSLLQQTANSIGEASSSTLVDASTAQRIALGLTVSDEVDGAFFSRSASSASSETDDSGTACHSRGAEGLDEDRLVSPSLSHAPSRSLALRRGGGGGRERWGLPTLLYSIFAGSVVVLESLSAEVSGQYRFKPSFPLSCMAMSLTNENQRTRKPADKPLSHHQGSEVRVVNKLWRCSSAASRDETKIPPAVKGMGGDFFFVANSMATAAATAKKAQDVITALLSCHGVPSTERVGFILTSSISILTLMFQRYLLRKYGRDLISVRSEDDTKISKKLYHSFIQVSKICLPTWKSREFLGSFVFISLFAFNAVLRVWAQRVNSRMLATMLSGDSSQRLENFVRSIISRCSVSLLEGLCSGAIQWIRPWLIGCYRERLCRDFQRRFFNQLVYYQSTVLDDRLERADSVIASYCGEFAEHFAELPYYFILPGLECLISGYALVEQSGAWSASLVGVVVTISVLLLQHIAPPFGRLHSLLLQRSDSYRRMLTSTLDNVENIALHGGGPHTLMCLNRTLAKLKTSLDHMSLAAGHFNMLETVLSSFLTIVANRSVNDVLLQVQYIEGLNCSVKNFIVNFRELSHLTEFSVKMWEFDRTLRSIASGTFIHSGPGGVDRDRTSSRRSSSPSSARVYSPRGEMEHDLSSAVFPIFCMENVTLLSPSDAVLLQRMTAKMLSDQDWVISGDNGTGKTSIIRMLTGLWFPKSGSLTVDKSVKFLIAPQHTYMAPECTLYEQIVFPMEAVPDPDDTIVANIKEAVRLAGAESVIQVAGGYDSEFMGLHKKTADTSFDWTRLSGGQKQRVSLARIFFYKLNTKNKNETVVAVLDESTSMMDDFEQDVITNIRRQEIRMISITHRESIIRHHSHVLRLMKQGRWSLEPVLNRLPIGEVAISPVTTNLVTPVEPNSEMTRKMPTS